MNKSQIFPQKRYEKIGDAVTKYIQARLVVYHKLFVSVIDICAKNWSVCLRKTGSN